MTVVELATLSQAFKVLRAGLVEIHEDLRRSASMGRAAPELPARMLANVREVARLEGFVPEDVRQLARVVLALIDDRRTAQ